MDRGMDRVMDRGMGGCMYVSIACMYGWMDACMGG